MEQDGKVWAELFPELRGMDAISCVSKGYNGYASWRYIGSPVFAQVLDSPNAPSAMDGVIQF